MVPVIIIVLAHNEERRIATCLGSLLREPGRFPIHVVVNGSTDGTAEIAGNFGDRTSVHIYPEGGKARSWNRFVLDTLPAFADVTIFVDGDAEIVPGAIAALVDTLSSTPSANAVAGQARNGRNAARYRREQAETYGLFGDLYALRGSFLERMKRGGLRLPEDLIGDDSLIGALAKTDLEREDNWDEARISVCAEAGFLCEPVSLASPHTVATQYRRMINYSVRHFQSLIVSEIMQDKGPSGLPVRMAQLYPEWLPKFRGRLDPRYWWFDRCALKRMAAAITAAPRKTP
jgi:glycosyltransferase involved in cell wall biosynthesis